MRLDIRYLTQADSLQPSLKAKPAALFGQLNFTRSLKAEMVERSGLPAAPEPNRKDVTKTTRDKNERPQRGFSVMGHDTFVQAKVDQTYTFVTAVPESTHYLLVWAEFEYAQKSQATPKRNPVDQPQPWIDPIYTPHATDPHTTQGAYALEAGAVVAADRADEASADLSAAVS
jgi:hypothetical protein